MAKKKYYLVLDSETATCEFADEIAKGNPERKKRIAIAKPLIYNLGWVICDRHGEIYDRKEYLISEIFSVPSIYNTAYYKDKRPIYLEKLKRKEIILTDWNTAIEALIEDLKVVDAVGCFNSMFDMVKAIPYTELYIKKLYSPDYYEWEKQQRSFCEYIANNKPNAKEPTGRVFNTFKFRDIEVPLFDIWGLACKYLLNTQAYKNLCLDLGMLTNSGDYFKTSAESSYRYLCEKYDFDEEHTALADAEIEAFILSKIASRRAVEMGIEYFPFRLLGNTSEFIRNTKKPKQERINAIYYAMKNYIDSLQEISTYAQGIASKMEELKMYME